MTDCHALLAAWERGVVQAPRGRAAGMLQQLDPDSSPPRSLGERNHRLLELHARVFGDDVELTSRCPQCGATVQFNIRCSALTCGAFEPTGTSDRFEVDGVVIDFRLPDASDVAVIASVTSSDHEFARQLAARCVTSCSPASEALSDPVIDALSRRMELLDPLAVVSFALECQDCACTWNAPLDVEGLVWTKVQNAAERLLLDVDALARAYGWTEREVLALPPARRAAYLQLADA